MRRIIISLLLISILLTSFGQSVVKVFSGKVFRTIIQGKSYNFYCTNYVVFIPDEINDGDAVPVIPTPMSMMFLSDEVLESDTIKMTTENWFSLESDRGKVNQMS